MAPTVASPSLAPTVYGPAVAAASFRMMATDQRRSAGGGANITASSVSARGACAVGAAGAGASPHVEQKMLRPMMPSIAGFACRWLAPRRPPAPATHARRAAAAGAAAPKRNQGRRGLPEHDRAQRNSGQVDHPQMPAQHFHRVILRPLSTATCGPGAGDAAPGTWSRLRVSVWRDPRGAPCDPGERRLRWRAARVITAAMSRRAAIALAVASIAACRCSGGAAPPPETPCAKPEEIATLRLNQLQLVGSHNSYRRHTYKPIFDLIQSFGPTAPEGDQHPIGGLRPPAACGEQLTDYGMRALELDLFNDPAGGRFYERQGLRFINEPPASNLPELNEPGHEGAARPRLRLRDAPPDVRVRAARDRRRGATRPASPAGVHRDRKQGDDGRRRAHQPGSRSRAVRRGGRRRAGRRDSVRVRVGASSADEVRGADATLDEAVTTRAGRGRSVRAGCCSSWKGRRSSPTWRAAPGLAGRLIFAQSTPGEAHAAVVFSNDPVGGRPISGSGAAPRHRPYDGGQQPVQARSDDRTRMNARSPAARTS